MFKKIFLTIISVIVIAMAITITIILIGVYNAMLSSHKQNLKQEVQMLALMAEQKGDVLQLLEKMRHSRITWINADGTIKYETMSDKTENHAKRPEVIMAFQNGYGEICRTSASMLQTFCYAAMRLQDGTVMRAGISAESAFAVFFKLLKPMFAILICAGIAAVFFARKMAKKIVEPINHINIDEPYKNDIYPEINPLLKRIGRQQQEIQNSMECLRGKAEEFDKITSAMREGLLLLDSSFRIINVNSAADRIFKTNADIKGSNLLHLERNASLTKALGAAQENGFDTCRITRNGLVYKIRINRVNSQNTSLVLLIQDITEQVQMEQRRREFTANVSHELKTPLQTIIGSSELLEHGFVKEKDVPDFAGKINREALRLLKLTDDIIHLSRLDEQIPLPSENFDLYELCKSCENHFKTLAEEKNIQILVKGENSIIFGVKTLAEEIVFNLCENAIKYNKNNGMVEMFVKRCGNNILLDVKDTGIGIKACECGRIFERFYRVDKSHSKSIGGTGLGLSIVRHAARQFNAEIKVESEPQKGSLFRIVFPAANVSVAKNTQKN